MLDLFLNVVSPPLPADYPPFGNPTAGYWGIVQEEDFISAAALASAIGLTTGTVVNAVKPAWLKFSNNGKFYYMALRAFRHTLTYDSIYNRGAAGGDKPTHIATAVPQTATIVIDGIIYQVRQCWDAEWVKLVYPLANTWVPEVVSQMNIGNVTGAARWINDVGQSGSYRQWRGWTSITATAPSGTATNTAPASSGWSPVLEEIGRV